jgi:hypothetical protein
LISHNPTDGLRRQTFDKNGLYYLLSLKLESLPHLSANHYQGSLVSLQILKKP